MFQPSDEINIRLTVAEWNEVLGVLNTGAYRVVAPLIGKITEQANAAAQQQPKPKPAPADAAIALPHLVS